MKKWATSKYCSQPCSIKNTQVQKQTFGGFLKGHKPWNKGVKGLQISPLETRFKKGNLGHWLGKKRPEMCGEKKPRVTIRCKHCGIERRLAPNEVKDGRKFCSALCYSTWHRGANSPVYKGEEAVSRFRGRIAQLPEYRQWHAAILKRDGYRCVLCGTKSSRLTPLEVDHIKRFLFIANEYELRTPEDARKCAELWDIENGRTLCNPCHRISDTYGTKGLGKLINQKTKTI